MASERGGRNGDTVCPLHGPRARDAASAGPCAGRAPAGEQVDWAGLPVNLDMVFSQQQLDRVYAQHLMRERGTRLRRRPRGGAQPCACDAAPDGGRSSPDAAESMSSR